MSHTDTNTAPVEKIVSMGVREAREAIDQINDITLLDRIIAAEEAGKGRKSLIGLARLRADGLRESGEAEISVDEDPGLVGITLPSGITNPTDLVSIQIGANRDEAEQATQEAPAEAETAPPEVQAEPAPAEPQEQTTASEAGSVDDCARAFFSALRQGNAGLVAALLAEVRREGADDTAMAEALIRAHGARSARQKVAPRHPQANRRAGQVREAAPVSQASLDKLKAAIEHAKAAGRAGEDKITITQQDMDASGWAMSWGKYPSIWLANRHPGAEAHHLGYTPKLILSGEAPVVELTKII